MQNGTILLSSTITPHLTWICSKIFFFGFRISSGATCKCQETTDRIHEFIYLASNSTTEISGLCIILSYIYLTTTSTGKPCREVQLMKTLILLQVAWERCIRTTSHVRNLYQYCKPCKKSALCTIIISCVLQRVDSKSRVSEQRWDGSYWWDTCQEAIILFHKSKLNWSM